MTSQEFCTKGKDKIRPLRSKITFSPFFSVCHIQQPLVAQSVEMSLLEGPYRWSPCH